jgi:Xaa-Pro aminopeptidase
MNYQAQRRERLARYLVENDLDGFLVTNPVNVSYLTNFSGDASYLLLGRDQLLFVSDGRYTQQLREECPELPLHIRPPTIRVTQAAGECLKKIGWRKIGVEAGHLSIGEFEAFKGLVPGADWKPSADAVERLRLCKDASEVAQIKEAIGMAERAFAKFRASLKPTDTEKELSDRMEMLVRAEGARCTSFPTIVAVDERAALPHCPPSDKKLGDGQLVLVDWGACGRFYRSDLTRVLTTRTITPQLEKVWVAVLSAQARAIAAIRPGVQAQTIDAAARAALTEAGYGEKFNHALGHGIGIDVHEAPRLGGAIEMLLEPGMVVTVEPGVYLEGWGGVRIEDDVLVTDTGCEVLSSLGKELREAGVGW